MSRIPNERECVEYLIAEGCSKRVVVHCCTVRAVADQMMVNIKGADPDLVVAGSILHDIGRSVDHTIMHACIGAQIGERLGLPQELCEIIRKHTGAGLDRNDVVEMGLPAGDYIPRTIEEKIVAHADNMVKDNRVVTHDVSVSKLIQKGAFAGADRIEALHLELSDLYGDDLDTIVREIGEYPQLRLVDEYDIA